jgi:hypothetical protein
MTTHSLTALLDQGPAALTEASTQLVAQQAQLDGSGVERLTREQLTALFAAIPPDWEMADLHAVIAADTLSEALAQQLATWLDMRLGRANEQTTPEAAPTQVEAAAETPSRPAVALRTDLEQALINDLRGACAGPIRLGRMPIVFAGHRERMASTDDLDAIARQYAGATWVSAST